MRTRYYARAVVALVAAYAVALQAILLVLGGPIAGAGDFAAQPICSAFGAAGTGSAPVGHEHDCLAACLIGCCCGATAAPAPGAILVYALKPARTVGAAGEAATPTLRLSATGAHRSRAPPLG